MGHEVSYHEPNRRFLAFPSVRTESTEVLGLRFFQKIVQPRGTNHVNHLCGCEKLLFVRAGHTQCVK